MRLNPALEWRSLFPAKITGRAEHSGSGGGKYRYSWTEQYLDPITGKLTDAQPARAGTSTRSPAYEMNGKIISPGNWVWMRFRGFEGGQPVYEFSVPGGASEARDAPPDTPELTYRIVSKVCPNRAPPLNQVQSLKVETRTITFPAGTVASEPFCITNPNTCCQGGSSVTVCGTVRVPATLYAVIQNGAFSCAEGTVVTLTHDAGISAWIGTAAFGTCGYSATFTLSAALSGSTCNWTLGLIMSDECYFSTGLNSSRVAQNSSPLYVQYQFRNMDACSGLDGGNLYVYVTE
jgi:hypothetical protein